MSAQRNAPGGAEASGGAVENSATADSSLIVMQDAEVCRAARDAADKRFCDLRVRAALAGIEVYIISNDGRAEYLAARWGWTKNLPGPNGR